VKKSADLRNPLPLFLQEEFLRWQGQSRVLEEEGISIAIFGEGSSFSPARAPFGGFAVKQPGRLSGLQNILAQIEKLALEGSFFQLEIQLAPPCYSPDIPLINESLEQAGFHRKWTDLNYHLPVDRPFRAHLHRSERWKLSKSGRMGFYFEAVPDPDWQQVHTFILNSRQRKGYHLSMSEEELRASHQQFPGKYRVWQVCSPEGDVAAMAVTVDVDAVVEYIFYTADDVRFRSLSPVVMLHDGIYFMAEATGKKMLDLGTASHKGEINWGVADFKRFLGGMETEKVRLQKNWDKLIEYPAGK
jgi:hypothetical protein